MKHTALLGIVLITSSCATTKTPIKVFSHNQTLVPTSQYYVDFQWSDFAIKPSKKLFSVNCVFHQVDFKVDAEGKVMEAKLTDSSNSELEKYSLEAVKRWTFNTDIPEKNGRIVYIYRKTGKVDAVLHDPKSKFSIYRVSQPKDLGYESSDLPDPIPVRRINPSMPKQAAMKRIEGTNIVAFKVLPDGTTDQIKVIDAYPKGVFDKASIKAIEKWRYETSSMTRETFVRLDYRIDGGSFCNFGSYK
ncbi:MAG: TonB family protein [Pseudobacteriovorax sp.]|nr:TonB family protein [Pseudobacteriovorax sp.]